MLKQLALLVVLCLVIGRGKVLAQQFKDKNLSKTYTNRSASVFAIEGGGAFGRVALSESFLRGENRSGTPIRHVSSAHLKLLRQSPFNSYEDVVYGSPYIGIGASYSSYGHPMDIGRPWSIYLLQGARIFGITNRLSVNYEWNFGVSAGWNAYNKRTNPLNNVVGTKVNAYIGCNLFAAWMINRYLDLNMGLSAAHFSNGNTRVPNAGVNTLQAYVGVRAYFNRDYTSFLRQPNIYQSLFKRRMQYEFLLYSAWKDMMIDTKGTGLETPYLNKNLGVFGVVFSPMYHLSPKVRLGGSVDLSYDESAGMRYLVTGPTSIELTRAKFSKQISVGLAAKVDFVMPFVALSGSLGYDVAHANKLTNAFYQIVAVKFNVVRSIFLNVGYKTRSFTHPDNLMLGVGFVL